MEYRMPMWAEIEAWQKSEMEAGRMVRNESGAVAFVSEEAAKEAGVVSTTGQYVQPDVKVSPLLDNLSFLQSGIKSLSKPFNIEFLKPYLPYILIGFGALIVLSIIMKPKSESFSRSRR